MLHEVIVPIALTAILFTALLLMDARRPPAKAKLASRSAQASVFFFLTVLTLVGYNLWAMGAAEEEAGDGGERPSAVLLERAAEVERDLLRRIGHEPIHIGSPHF